MLQSTVASFRPNNIFGQVGICVFTYSMRSLLMVAS